MGNDLSVIAPKGLDAVKETKAAAGLMLLLPTTFLDRFQNGTAKRTVRYIQDAVGADKAAEELSLETLDNVVEAVKREDDDKAGAVNAGAMVKVETVKTFTIKSINAEERAKFSLRQAALARHLRTESDFSFLKSITDEEKATLTKLRHDRRQAVMLPKKERAAAIGAILVEYGNLRKSIIDRLAADPDATDEALKA